jgi:hypothetical protein
MMSQEQEGQLIRARTHVGGDLSGQVAVGRDIRQEQRIGVTAERPTEAELAELRAAFEEFIARVAEVAPPELREAAVERAEELSVAATADEPDLTTIEYARNWLASRLPQLRAALTSLVFHPVLAKVVATGGDVLAMEFRRRMGG